MTQPDDANLDAQARFLFKQFQPKGDTHALLEQSASEILSPALKTQVIAELRVATQGQMLGAGHGGTAGQLSFVASRDPINDPERDNLINQLLDIFFKNASPETRNMICGVDYDSRKGDIDYLLNIAKKGLTTVWTLVGAGVLTVAFWPATIAAVALVIAQYSKDNICNMKMPAGAGDTATGGAPATP